MCVALPGRVVRLLSGSRALVEQQGREFEVGTLMTPGVSAGDHVLINLGQAVQVMSEREANEVFDLWGEIGRAMASGFADKTEKGTNEG